MVRKIPISAAEKISFDDEENGVRYFIKPRTGRIDMKFTAIVELINNVSIMDKIDAVCDIVDLFLCGAEAIDKSVKLPQIPAGIKYTDVLDSDSIIFVYNEIMKSFGLFVEEKKVHHSRKHHLQR